MTKIIDLDKYRPVQEPEKIRDDQNIIQCALCGYNEFYVTPEFSLFCGGCECLILDNSIVEFDFEPYDSELFNDDEDLE